MQDPWHDWGVFFSCVFDYATPKIKASSPSEWSGWERDQSYCERCFSKFLKEYTWQWFLEERVKGAWLGFLLDRHRLTDVWMCRDPYLLPDGWVPPENCG